MLLKGEAFVPPSCPAKETGPAGDIVQMEFFYDTHTYLGASSGQSETEVIVQFFKRDNDKLDGTGWSTVATSTVYIGDTELALQAQQIAEGPKAVELQKRFREIMCERVINCRGVLNGECWAIGVTALGEIHNQVIDELATTTE